MRHRKSISRAIGRPVPGHDRGTGPARSLTNIEAFREWSVSPPETLDAFVTAGAEDFLILVDVRTSVVYEHLHKDNIAPLA